MVIMKLIICKALEIWMDQRVRIKFKFRCIVRIRKIGTVNEKETNKVILLYGILLYN